MTDATHLTVTVPDRDARFLAFTPKLLPSGAWQTPSEGSVYIYASTYGTVPLSVSAKDDDGHVTKVEFYQGATKVGEDVHNSSDPVIPALTPTTGVT